MSPSAWNDLLSTSFASGTVCRIVGAALLVLSESFIGHTASVEPSALVIVSDAIRMMAAGTWVAVVAVIGGIGLHNRRTLLPALEQPGIEVRFFRTILIEAALFAAVLIITALLVVANPLP